MKIRITDISEKEKILAATEPVDSYPSLLEAQDSGECRFTEPVTITLSVQKEYDHIRAHGSISTAVILACSRCLEEFATPVASSFTIFYSKSESGVHEEEVELGEEDLLSVTYSGDEINFSDEIAEQVLLEIPYKPLCSENCKGLCPVCGTDLNHTACSCSDNNTGFTFSALKGLKVTN